MKYFIGNLTVDGATDSRREDDAGIICIGGDTVDVYANAAYGVNDGMVRLVNVTIVTGDNFKGFNGQKLHDELKNAAKNAIAESYASIGTETFLRSRKAEFPMGEHLVILNSPSDSK